MKKDKLIENIKNFLFESDEVEFAYLFGSYAIDKETPLSDIDIAIYQKKHKSAYEYRMAEFKIESELTELMPNIKFDVRSFNDAPILVIGKILNEGKLLFYKDDNFYFDYLVNKRMRYMDFLIVYNPLFEERYKNLLNGE